MTAHPLDRPVWSALTGRQAARAKGDARAWRFAPEYGPFAAAADASAASLAALAALIPPAGVLWLAEADPPPAPAGTIITRADPCLQMVAERMTAAGRPITPVALGDADAAEMLALARLTRPGPFEARTHRLGNFIGLRDGGALVAMAGERLRPEGFTEVSGVCTHPDHRGRGHAGGLMRIVADAILARGDTPFLQVYTANRAAVALYATLGFVIRREITLTVLERADAAERSR